MCSSEMQDVLDADRDTILNGRFLDVGLSIGLVGGVDPILYHCGELMAL